MENSVLAYRKCSQKICFWIFLVVFCSYHTFAFSAQYMAVQWSGEACLDTAMHHDINAIQLSDSLDGSRFVMDAPWYNKRKPWRAAAEVVGINASFLAFDYFVLKADFAKVTAKTLSRNIRLQQWFWDSDRFYTNLLYHPYHGNLFFNAARSNGMNFWESIGYTAAGDMLWEIAGESELPSINDAISTAMGGVAIGETTYRVSSMVYDDSKQGFPRFARELLGAAINPIRGLNRVLTGEAWKVRRHHHLYHDFRRFPVRMSVVIGNRYVVSNNPQVRHFHTPYLDFSMAYGDAFSDERRPYDYFTAEAGIVAGNHQKLFNNIHITGQLYATQVNDSNRVKLRFGVYQHFNYDYATALDETKSPYQLSEAASIGIGMMCRVPDVFRRLTVRQDFFVNAMFLGGVWSDYSENIFSRTYNMGSGFTAKTHTVVSIPRCVSLSFDTRLFRMFSWHGYEDEEPIVAGQIVSAQGERNNTTVWVLRPQLGVRLWKGWGLNLSAAYYYRHSHYKYKEDARARTYEWRLGVMYNVEL